MSEELVIRGSRARFLRMLVIGTCLVALSYWTLAEQHMWLLGGAGLIFFGFGLVVTVLMMRPGTTYLRLHPSGFDVVAMKRPCHYLWSDVDGFYLASLSGAEVVAIQFNESCKSQRIGRALAGGLTGIEGAISNIFERPPAAVCAVLNEWKSSYGDASAAIQQPHQ